MLYIKWLTESSNFAYDQGGVPVLKSQEYPETLAAFDGIELLEDTTAPDEIADLAVNVQQEAELMLNADQTHVMRIVEAGINGERRRDHRRHRGRLERSLEPRRRALRPRGLIGRHPVRTVAGRDAWPALHLL